MKTTFTDSFFESIKRITIYQSWWYKTFEFFRYDIWRFFGNIWKFRKELYQYQNYDWRYNIMLFRRGLELEVKCIQNGQEEDVSRDKKVNKMKRAIEIIKYHENDCFLELAEKELGYEYIFKDFDFKETDKELDPEITKSQKYYELIDKLTEEEKDKNSKLSDLSIKMKKDTWNELSKILKGQKYSKTFDWDKDFDGSGLQTWWD
jgi:hypothetical protein